MFIITTKIRGEVNYLGWQNPAWDEDGYFWTSKENITEIIKRGYNTSEHPFLFNTIKEAKDYANNKIGLVNIWEYAIEQWQ